ncbi:MAG: HesA/MoeB/ThiF family protein [Syntrophorhabdaceae bacterium]
MKMNNGANIGFTIEEIERYSRQLMVPGVGVREQELLKKARVCIAGAGGLGSISAYYLAAAGVGRLRIVDNDKVEVSNLNRQILHFTPDIGEPKVLSAQCKIENLNPYCRVEAVQGNINEDNVFEIIDNCDIVIDALDNIATRRMINFASLHSRTPLIYGGVEGFSGMASTFIPYQTPCFECIFSHISEDDVRKGVVGMLPAIIGSIQALEAMKLVIGQPPSLAGTLLYFSGQNMTFQHIAVEKNPLCNVCGKQPVVI